MSAAQPPASGCSISYFEGLGARVPGCSSTTAAWRLAKARFLSADEWGLSSRPKVAKIVAWGTELMHTSTTKERKAGGRENVVRILPMGAWPFCAACIASKANIFFFNLFLQVRGLPHRRNFRLRKDHARQPPRFRKNLRQTIAAFRDTASVDCVASVTRPSVTKGLVKVEPPWG